LPKLTSGRPPHELAYIAGLFSIATSPIADQATGPEVVTFFKKSKLEVVSNLFLTTISKSHLALFCRRTCGKFGLLRAC